MGSLGTGLIAKTHTLGRCPLIYRRSQQATAGHSTASALSQHVPDAWVPNSSRSLELPRTNTYEHMPMILGFALSLLQGFSSQTNRRWPHFYLLACINRESLCLHWAGRSESETPAHDLHRLHSILTSCATKPA